MELEVHELAGEEVYRSWVRIPEKYRLDTRGRTIPNAAVVHIACKGKSILAIARGDVASAQPTIKIEDLYRDALDISTGHKFDFGFHRANLYQACAFYWNHPDPPTAFTMKIAILSLVLGLFGLILGALPLFSRC